MKGNHLLDKMELAAPEFIEAAEKAKRKRRPAVWVALAASAALAIAAGFWFLPEKPPEVASDLPMLTVTENFGNSGMGYEGYTVYDFSEIKNANPWTPDCHLTTLPVYKNVLEFEYYYGHQLIGNLDYESMLGFLYELASDLGLSPEDLTVTDNNPKNNSQSIDKLTDTARYHGIEDVEGFIEKCSQATVFTATAEGIKITVYPDMRADIFFEPTRDLPEKYDLGIYSSYEEKLTAAKYLKKEYRDFIDYTSPKINIYGGDYDIYKNQNYAVSFFDSHGSLAEQIVNYNFFSTGFYGHVESKGLWIIRTFRPDLSQKVGDYPVISVEEATGLLNAGNYVTSAPQSFPGEDHIAGVELVYRHGMHDKYFIPYYRFYAELPPSGWAVENGFKNYVTYYVPAIESQYIADMPLWDGGINR